MFTYGQAESLLAKLHGIEDEALQRGAFRARLKNFKKFGIPLNISPGSGSKFLYLPHEIYQWEFCLSLTELGIDPASIGNLMRTNWSEMISNIFRKASDDYEKTRARTYVIFVPNKLSSVLNDRPSEIVSYMTSFSFDAENALFDIGRFTRACWFEITPVIVAVLEEIERIQRYDACR